ncbi:MAG: hypothetical protein D6692_06980 [Planctomycetota bacterium]|nr:MAG: hypothetical protein D6692_06980 [Planctomycetota bacterium]
MPDAPARAACEVFAPEPLLGGVTVRWRVLRRAVQSLAPAGESPMVELRVSVQGLGAKPRASVTIVDPQSGCSREPLAPGDVSAEVIPDIRGEVHIEVPDWLHATIAPDDAGRWTLIYARSPVLECLRIPGGRAEVIGVEIV